MRIFKNFIEAKNEIRREFKEMGVKIDNISMQDKHGIFPTLELQNYAYTVLEPNLADLNPVLPWAQGEWVERVQGIEFNPVNPGAAWTTRTDEHIKWFEFLEIDGEALPTGVSLKNTSPKGPSRFAYNYSERLAVNQQVWRIIRELRKNPTSRQLYIAMWDPHTDPHRLGHNRVPCSIGWHFLLRDHHINMTYTMRSCDLITHWDNDVWLAVKLQMYIAQGANIEMGQFCQFVHSFHVYLKDVEEVF